MNIFLLIFLLFGSILYIIFVRNDLKTKEAIIKELIKEKDRIEDFKKKELTTLFKKEKQEQELILDQLKASSQVLQAQIDERVKTIDVLDENLKSYRNDRIKEIDSAIEEYKERNQLIVDNAIINYRNKKKDNFNSEMTNFQQELDLKKKEISTINENLADLRKKQFAINEESRKFDEKEDYIKKHSIELSSNEKEDIHFLLSLEEKLHNKQILYKLIWSQYLQQALKNTLNNILGGRDPRNVIYCIENIENGKKYIGKTSAEVSKRWTEHIKTSLNIGSIKSTNIHKALYNNWDKFIFYIIEETSKEKLSELEKYYIQFYESNKYGYNIKSGG